MPYSPFPLLFVSYFAPSSLSPYIHLPLFSFVSRSLLLPAGVQQGRWNLQPNKDALRKTSSAFQRAAWYMTVHLTSAVWFRLVDLETAYTERKNASNKQQTCDDKQDMPKLNNRKYWSCAVDWNNVKKHFCHRCLQRLNQGDGKHLRLRQCRCNPPHGVTFNSPSI